MNEAYRDVIISRIGSALSEARALGPVTHHGVRGQLRECLMRDLFRPLLPADVGVGTGQIASAHNRLSPQADIVIYNRAILPPVLFEGANGIFPIEAVLAAIEVKTTLTSTELRGAEKNAEALATLTYLPGIRDPFSGVVVQHPLEAVVSGVFALNSDLSPSGMSEIDRLRALSPGGQTHIRLLCVAGRGMWFRIADDWYAGPQVFEHSEVVAFVTSLSSSLRRIAQLRGDPELSHYLFDPGDLLTPKRDPLTRPSTG